uniref:Uncharacterized protein n=1 Tax=Helianthus annuus TaxID=4232 RepID=A0A251S8W6_HELAN
MKRFATVNKIPSTPWFQPSLVILQVIPFSGSRDDDGGVTEEVPVIHCLQTL